MHNLLYCHMILCQWMYSQLKSIAAPLLISWNLKWVTTLDVALQTDVSKRYQLLENAVCTAVMFSQYILLVCLETEYLVLFGCAHISLKTLKH